MTDDDIISKYGIHLDLGWFRHQNFGWDHGNKTCWNLKLGGWRCSKKSWITADLCWVLDPWTLGPLGWDLIVCDADWRCTIHHFCHVRGPMVVNLAVINMTRPSEHGLWYIKKHVSTGKIMMAKTIHQFQFCPGQIQYSILFWCRPCSTPGWSVAEIILCQDWGQSS